MGSYTERLTVTCSPGNIPSSVSYDGREYRVCEIPSRWYPRPAPHGQSPRAEYELWRVQLVRDLTGQELTLDLAHYTDPDHWRLIKLHGATALQDGGPGGTDDRSSNVRYADFSRSA